MGVSLRKSLRGEKKIIIAAVSFDTMKLMRHEQTVFLLLQRPNAVNKAGFPRVLFACADVVDGRPRYEPQMFPLIFTGLRAVVLALCLSEHPHFDSDVL